MVKNSINTYFEYLNNKNIFNIGSFNNFMIVVKWC